jgi:inosine-uridine nucleoside N-ribohydrolase
MSSYSFVVTDSKRVRVILDTDTACEADDPFAIAEALLSPKMIVKAIIAEHFLEEGSQQKSYEAIGRLTEAMELDPLTLHGEEGPLQEGAEISEGARFIVEEARRDDPLPLYVLGLGALSTIAAALREAPDIADRMTVVTIGGLPYEKDSPFAGFREFNFGNDVGAANLLLASAVPVWQIPMNVYTTMRIGLAEIELRIGRAGRPGKYLFDQMAAYNATPRAFWTPGKAGRWVILRRSAWS